MQFWSFGAAFIVIWVTWSILLYYAMLCYALLCPAIRRLCEAVLSSTVSPARSRQELILAAPARSRYVLLLARPARPPALRG